MFYLIAAGSIALVFGLILLLTPKFFKELCLICDKSICSIDEQLQSYKYSTGLVLILIAVWVFFMTIKYPEIALTIHPFWIIALIFGLLYLFFPNWLIWVSRISDKNIFSADQYVIGACRVAGTVLLIASVYIFHAAFILGGR